jgi:endoglucanase
MVSLTNHGALTQAPINLGCIMQKSLTTKLFLPLVGFILLSFVACSSSTQPQEEEPVSSEQNGESSQEQSSSATSSDSLQSSSSQNEWVPTPVDSLLLIDNFESQQGAGSTTAKGGSWYSFTDNGNNGLSTMEPMEPVNMIVPEGFDSTNALQFAYALDKGTYKWDPYVAVGFDFGGNGFDATAFAGFSYWYNGPAHRVRIEISGVTDHDYHSMSSVDSRGAWKQVVVDFAEVLQEGWGVPVDFDAQDIHNITWEIKGRTGDSGTMMLDNIYFEKTIEYEIQNDMVLRDPEIPTEDTIGNVYVNTPLNERTMKYLTKGMNFTNWLEQDRFDGNNWTYDKEDVIRHAQQGFLGIRLPVDLDLYVIQRDSVVAGLKELQVDSLLWVVLDSMELWTAQNNLSLTIDYHQYDGSFTGTTVKDAGYREMASHVWKKVAEHFASNTREDLFYELTNEPNLGADNDKISSADWRVLAQQMIDSIRTVDATRPIIFGETDFYSMDLLAKSEPFADENIIYAFHFYDPFIYTHMGASWTGMATTRNIPFPYTKEEWNTEFRYFGVQPSTAAWIKNGFRNYYKQGNKTYLKNRLIPIKRWAYEHQVPLICNEWGAYQKNAKNEHLNNFNRTMGEIFEELDIAWQVWFGIFDTEGNLLPGISESMKLK